jgi:hypothetical protein
MLGKLDGSNIYRYERPRLVSGQETIQGRRTTTNYSFLGALEIERSVSVRKCGQLQRNRTRTSAGERQLKPDRSKRTSAFTVRGAAVTMSLCNDVESDSEPSSTAEVQVEADGVFTVPKSHLRSPFAGWLLILQHYALL